MKINRFVRGLAIALALVSAVASSTVQAADRGAGRTRTASATVVTDVSLADGGVLTGQVIDAQGVPQVKQSVRVVHNNQVVAAVMTGEEGRFTVSDLRGGLHQIETPNGSAAYRLWAPRTAPPAAHQTAVVTTGDVVRGQGMTDYAPALRGGVVGVLIGAGLYWAFDYNAGS